MYNVCYTFLLFFPTFFSLHNPFLMGSMAKCLWVGWQSAPVLTAFRVELFVSSAPAGFLAHPTTHIWKFGGENVLFGVQAAVPLVANSFWCQVTCICSSPLWAVETISIVGHVRRIDPNESNKWDFKMWIYVQYIYCFLSKNNFKVT